MELILFIGMIYFIVNVMKSVGSGEERKKPKQTTYQMPKRAERMAAAGAQLRQRYMELQHEPEPNLQKEILQGSGKRQQNTRPMTAMEQVRTGRREAQNTTILQRAKANVAEDMEDTTLHMMEAEHNHSERVAPAEHYHPEDIIPENMLGSIEDLMIKGYDGNLCFERDFVSEGLDMISRFTVPSDIPEFTSTYGS